MPCASVVLQAGVVSFAVPLPLILHPTVAPIMGLPLPSVTSAFTRLTEALSAGALSASTLTDRFLATTGVNRASAEPLLPCAVADTLTVSGTVSVNVSRACPCESVVAVAGLTACAVLLLSDQLTLIPAIGLP